MPLTNVLQHGAQYAFGLSSSDAPTIAGFKATSAETKYEPEVFVQSQEGEGHTDGVTVSKPDKAMGTITVNGYITDLVAYKGVTGGTFNFDGRKWIIKGISLPRKKGELVEGTVEAVSFALIT